MKFKKPFLLTTGHLDRLLFMLKINQREPGISFHIKCRCSVDIQQATDYSIVVVVHTDNNTSVKARKILIYNRKKIIYYHDSTNPSIGFVSSFIYDSKCFKLKPGRLNILLKHVVVSRLFIFSCCICVWWLFGAGLFCFSRVKRFFSK